MLQSLLALIPVQQVHHCREDGVEAEICLERGRVNRVLITVSRDGALVQEKSDWPWIELKLRLKTGWSPVPMPASQLEQLMWRAEDKQWDRAVGSASLVGGLVIGVLWLAFQLSMSGGMSSLPWMMMLFGVMAGQDFLRKRMLGNPWGPFIGRFLLPALLGLVYAVGFHRRADELWVLALSAFPLLPVRTPWDGEWDPHTDSIDKLPTWRRELIPMLTLVAAVVYIWFSF